jgi:hypothetical protein
VSYVVCECGSEIFLEPAENWKSRCLLCWKDSQDPDSPYKIRNLEKMLLWAESELGRRVDLGLAFKEFVPAMLKALEHLDDPKSRRCRLWLLRFLIPEDGHFDLELSLALDRAQVAVEAS